MESIKNYLIHFTLAITLACTVKPVAAEQFTASELKLKSSWRLEFKDGSALSFRTASGSLKLEWTGPGSRHPWLGQSQRVATQTLEEQDTTDFDRFSQKHLKSAKRQWQQAKKKHKRREEKRLLKEKNAYERRVKQQRQKHKAALAEWQQEKAEFDKEAKVEYQEALQAWKEEDQEYQQENQEYLAEKKEYEGEGASVLSPSSWFGPPDPPEPPPPKPIRRKFPHSEPQKPRMAKYTPSPIQPFAKSEPQLDTPPAYRVAPLVLYLASQKCPPQRFRLKAGKRIDFVTSHPSRIQGRSPWGASVELIQCDVLLKSGKPLLSLQSHEGRLVSLELQQPSTTLELLRIVSPELVRFERELAQREMHLKTLFREETVDANYRETQERTQLDLTYMATDKSVQLRTTLPVQFYDSSEKNKRNVISRLNDFQEKVLGNQPRLLLRQVTTHPPLDSSKWGLKAIIHYAFVDGEVANLIKVQNRSGGTLEELEIGSDGQVFDFSGLWYLASWMSRKGISEIPLVYFNDTRVFVMRLVRGGKDEFPFGNRKIHVTAWTVLNVEEVETFRFQVGTEDHIVYEFHDPGARRTLRLQQIGTVTTRENQKWASAYQKKHRLVSLFR